MSGPLPPDAASPLPAVHHDPANERFELMVDGHLCVCEYRRRDGEVWFTHTEVPAALAGRGIASALVEAGLDWAREQGLKVRPLCSYVSAWMRRHPEYRDLMAP